MAELRLFIAVELPSTWTVALAQMQDRLRRRGLERLRWVRPEGAHLTLKFLGNVDEARVPAIAEAMERAAGGVPSFNLRLGGAGVFGAPDRPRVVWAGVTGDIGPLTAVWRVVEGEVAPLGFPAERGRFSPHLTLARVPDGTPREVREAVAPAVAALGPPPAAPLQVEQIALMRSELGQGGARYTRLAAARLQENCRRPRAIPDPQGGSGVL